MNQEFTRKARRLVKRRRRKGIIEKLVGKFAIKEAKQPKSTQQASAQCLRNGFLLTRRRRPLSEKNALVLFSAQKSLLFVTSFSSLSRFRHYYSFLLFILLLFFANPFGLSTSSSPSSPLPSGRWLRTTI